MAMAAAPVSTLILFDDIALDLVSSQLVSRKKAKQLLTWRSQWCSQMYV